MPLAVAEIRDLRTFTKGFADTIIARDAVAPFNDVSTGFNLGVNDGSWGGSPANTFYSVYDHIRDRVLFSLSTTKSNTVPTVLLRSSVYMRDALCLNSSIGWYRDIASSYVGSSLGGRLKAGQPNLQTGEQKFYTFLNIPGTQHFELSAVDGTIAASDVWPGITFDFDTGPITSGNPGYYLHSATSQNLFGMIIFEGLTNTTGYSEITRGPATHTLGLALGRFQVVNVSGSNTTDVFAWLDLATDEIVGILDVPAIMDSTSTDPQAEPTLNGRSTEWDKVQFVPDEGSSFSQPKGELHFFTSEDGQRDVAFNIPGQSINAPEQTFTSTTSRNFVAVYEFNPFGVSTGTVRVHNRRTFLGIVDIPQEPIIQGGANQIGGPGIAVGRSNHLVYHPPSRTYLNVIGASTSTGNQDLDAPILGNSRIIRFRRALVVDRISQPTPDSEVTENRTIQARVVAHTDVGERAVGTQIDFVLSRLSTRAETFNGTTQGASAYIVAAGEIDDDGTLDVRHTNDVDNGGTILVDPTEYTVNYATGTLTPVGSWPSQSIFVRYRHRQVKLTPGHGTLQNSSGTTDGNGSVFALVQYGNNVDAEIDTLQASVA